MVLEEAVSVVFCTPCAEDDARARHSVDRVAFFVVLAQASPFTESLAIVDLQERDGRVMLLAEGSDQLGVSGVVALVGEDAQDTFVAVESLHGFTETTSETITVQGVLDHGLHSGLGISEFLFFHLFLNLVFDFDIFSFGRHICFQIGRAHV